MRLVPILVLALSLAALSACSQPEGGPPPAPTPTRPASARYQYREVRPEELKFEGVDLQEARLVDWIALRQPNLPFATSRPVWGESEPEKAAHILALLRKAAPAPDAGALSPDGNSFLTIRYRDGREVRVSHAFERLPSGAYRSVPGRMWIDGRGAVAAPELDKFYRGVAPVKRKDLLHPASGLAVDPPALTPGRQFRVQGRGWLGGTEARISILSGSVTKSLGRAAVVRGEFEWNGVLPTGMPPCSKMSCAIQVDVDGLGHYTSPVDILK